MPRPKPIEQLKISGGYREDRHGGHNPVVAADAERPAWLPDAAARVWDELAPTLRSNGLLKATDAPAFETLCNSVARYRELVQHVAETGPTVTDKGGVPRSNPAVRDLHQCADEVRRLCSDFGMTPVARRSVVIAQERGENPLDALLRKQNEGDPAEIGATA